MLRRQRLARSLHRLGPRVVFELIDEIIRHNPDLAEDIDARLERYAAANPSLIRWAGGDRFAPRPLRIVGDAA